MIKLLLLAITQILLYIVLLTTKKKMSKEYECFGYKDMMNLMSAIKAYDYDGWQLVSVGHNGKFYFAVVQRDKIEIEESEEK